MFEDIFGKVGGRDTRKMMETVSWLWEHRAQLSDLIERLPHLLQETGEGLEAAGSSAVNASRFLTGGQGGHPSVRQLSSVAADALEEGQEELREIATMLERLGRELDGIRIPSVRPRFAEVMGMNVMSGLDVGQETLFDDAATRLKGGSQRLGSLSTNLYTVAGQLREMGEMLTDTGTDLDRVGTQLRSSGRTLRSLSTWSEADDGV